MMNLIKKVEKDIIKTKNRLIAKAEKRGLYENFGDKEGRKLEDKYLNISSYTDEMNKVRDLFQEFSDWAGYYDGEK